MSKGRYSPFGKFAIGVGVAAVIMHILLPIVLAAAFLLGFFSLLRSCSQDFLPEEEVVADMEKIFPNVRLVSHDIVPEEYYYTPDTPSENNVKHVYCFDNMGVEFTLEAQKLHYWGTHISYENDYEERLGEFFTVETLCQSSPELDREKIGLIIPPSWASGLNYYYNVESVQEIPDAVDNFEIMYNIIYDYLPENNNRTLLDFSPKVKFGVYAPKGEYWSKYSETGDSPSCFVECLVVGTNKEINWAEVKADSFDAYRGKVNERYVKDPILTPDTAEESAEISEYEII